MTMPPPSAIDPGAILAPSRTVSWESVREVPDPLTPHTRVTPPPEIAVAAGPAPVIVRLLPMSSSPPSSVIVPAGTTIVDPAGAPDIASLKVPGLPSSARLVTVIVSALAATGESASAARTTARIVRRPGYESAEIDRKSTRLNSSHDQISYA